MPAQAGTHDIAHLREFSRVAQHILCYAGGGLCAEYKLKVPCVYILASKPNGVLYVGVTSDLAARMALHSQGVLAGFTKRYGIERLVYYEMHETMLAAIAREKQLKHWQRAWKVRLIHGFNPEWRDLFDQETGEISFGPADTERERG